MEPNANNLVREFILIGLTEIPEVGGLISGLTGILWPASQEDVWDGIENRVEQLIDRKLSGYEYQQVWEDLQGLNNAIDDYTTAVKDSQTDLSYISEKFNAAIAAFETAEPHFKSEGSEVLLLPLFAQMVNLYLSLLRDGVIFGKKWGWSDRDVADIQTKLTTQINRSVKYANDWYQQGYQNLSLPNDGSNLRSRIFKIQNAYDREMTLSVLDSVFYWPYFDPTVNPPGGTLPKLTREIYSDPQGTSSIQEFFAFTTPPPKIDNISVWGWDRIDAVQVSYGGVWGNRMGDLPTDTSGGCNQPPHGWNGQISAANPIVAVSGRSGDIINAMSFTFKDGRQTNECGGNYPGGDLFSWSFEGHILSFIWIFGVSEYYKSADCVVYGFRYEDSY
jgi:hypothetical protein